MSRLVGVALAVALLPFTVSAQEQEECTDRWLEAERNGIILGTAMMDGTPTFGVLRSVWDEVDYNVRAGMMETFICAMAGPGKTLTIAQIIDEKGRKSPAPGFAETPQKAYW
jgi:hypothetical protein